MKDILETGRRSQLLIISLDSPLFSKGAVHFSVGAESIAANVESRTGVYSKHIDLQIDHDETLSDLFNYIRSSEPEFIGVSTKIGSERDLDLLLEGLAEIKKTSLNYNPKIIIGGVYATFAALEIFDKAYKILKAPRDIFIVRRQGEYPLIKLIKSNFTDLHLIPDIAFYDSDSDLPVITSSKATPSKELTKFCDLVPPDTQTIKCILERNGVIWTEFSRGCKSFCTFCSIAELRGNRNLEERKAEDVINHLHKLSEMGVSSVAFSDDDFPITSSNAQDFARLMEETSLNRRLGFSFSTRATNIVRPGDDPDERARKQKCFQAFVKAGLKEVFVGLESFSAPQLKRYGIFFGAHGLRTSEKKQAAANLEVVEILDKANVGLVAGFISIDPLMTDLAELECNLSTLKNSGMYMHVTNPLHVLRVQVDTAYERLAKKAGLISPDRKEDLVFYDSEYQSEVVERIALISGIWNARKGATDYALKAMQYSSYGDDTRRFVPKRVIEDVRLLDISLGLKLCEAGKKVTVLKEFNQEGFERIKIPKTEREVFDNMLFQILIEGEKKRLLLFRNIIQADYFADREDVADLIQSDIAKIEEFLCSSQLDSSKLLNVKTFLGKRDKLSVERAI